jgi:S-(hydroxymethyl)glutathione dehydrogenase/alcohol dehydrogenase
VLTRAAVLHEQPGKWETVEVELEEPRQDELLIRMAAAGLCHSDDHAVTGDLPLPPGALPMAGGHEGAGVVEAVGPYTEGWKVGDRIVLSFMPMCGLCRWCASGLQNLCDNGGRILSGVRSDGTARMSLDGQPVSQAAGVSTFSELTTVSVHSAVRCPDDVSLEAACLVSCGATTGWGAAVRSAEVKPGDVVVVMGIGGIGINAVQGAAHAGASVVIAVDPVEMKRATALTLGATHAVATMAEATDLARGFTNGQGADAAILCVGVTKPEHIAAGVESIRKAGTCVLVGLGAAAEDIGMPVSAREVVLYQKRIQGSLFGASSPSKDIPAMIELYRRGRLKLDELISNRYSLEKINDGYADLRAGRNLRGIIAFGS